MDKTELRARLEFRRAALTELRTAYLALVNGQVASYTIGSRNLTRFDLTKLKGEIKEAEKELDALEAMAAGGSRRKAVGVIPRD
jgi:hypothetical protein